MSTRGRGFAVLRGTRSVCRRDHLPPHYYSCGLLGSNDLSPNHTRFLWRSINPTPWSRFYCSGTIADASDAERKEEKEASESRHGLSDEETRALLRHIKLEDFKKRLLASSSSSLLPSSPSDAGSSSSSSIALREAIRVWKQTGIGLTDAEAEGEIRKLDEAGAILVFRKRVFLEPKRVAEALSRAATPLLLASSSDGDKEGEEEDPRKKELRRLEMEKAEIDKIAEKQVKRMLWGAMVGWAAQSAVFFRLTFWDLSWDVMEPIAFFFTSATLLMGFFFFVVTHRDPSYTDLMRVLQSAKQKKLMKKRNFDDSRLKELQKEL